MLSRNETSNLCIETVAATVIFFKSKNCYKQIIISKTYQLHDLWKEFADCPETHETRYRQTSTRRQDVQMKQHYLWPLAATHTWQNQQFKQNTKWTTECTKYSKSTTSSQTNKQLDDQITVLWNKITFSCSTNSIQ